MTDRTLALFCLVLGEDTLFCVDISENRTVDDLKDAIKLEKANAFSDVDANNLKLWSVSISVADNPNWLVQVRDTPLDDNTKLKATLKLRDVFGTDGINHAIRVIIQRPPR
ncbi:hypothetical protein BGZ83_001248, partial [Gryganskiella cystojenkinii]